MEVKKHSNLKIPVLPALLFLVPAALCLLFAAVKSNRSLMDFWVYQIMGPTERLWGRLWALLPFSGMELWIASALIGSVIWLIRAFFLLIRHKKFRKFLHRIFSYLTVCLWVLAAFNWLWNAAYYASTFSQRSGLNAVPYTTEELFAVTVYFAQQAAELSDDVLRDEDGYFAESIEDCFQRGPEIYDNIVKEFPCLQIDSMRAKPIFFSRLQSIMGFTGMYFPFTGEANVNIDAPACLVPATIAHEMAHQRMVASELEANFVGIAAATSCDDVVFQYSGYLQGLIQTSNALYSVAPQAWDVIVEHCFTPELSRDWNQNYHYWDELSSPVEEAAEETYDSFLKHNDQVLGIRSYGACVDLLVTYFGAKMV